MNRRRVLAIVAAVVLTAFGTIVLIAYVNSAEQRAQEGTELVTVLYAVGEIEAGTPASELVGSELIAPRQVPGTVRAPDAVTSIGELGGEEALQTIFANTPILEAQFGEAAAAGGSGPASIDAGREIISISLEPQRALGGSIREGDFVGVLASLEGADIPQTDGASGSADSCGGATTAMVLTSVRIVDVRGVNDETGETGNAITVSFDVEQSQAEKLAFAAEYGRIWLTRQREDSPVPNVGVETCDDIFDDLRGQD